MKEYGAMRKGFNTVTVLNCALYLYIIKQDIRIYMLRKVGQTAGPIGRAAGGGYRLKKTLFQPIPCR